MWRNLWSEMEHLIQSYCGITSMHGFRHIIGNRLSFIEKCIWATICLTAATFCIILMIFSYQSTQERLTLIQLTDRNSPLYKLDFPAVTVCNFNKVYKPKADSMQKKLLRAGFNNKQVELFFLNLPQLIRPDTRPIKDNIDYVVLNKMLYTLSSDLKKLMDQLMQPCDKLLKSCTWIGVSYNCSILFKMVDSFVGQCCGFNYHVSQTFADRNYSPQCKKFYDQYNLNKNLQCKNKSECPGRNNVLKTPGSGVNAGLTVELNIEPEMYLGSITNYVGAFVLIHGPKDFPETDILTATVQPNHEVNVIMSGTVIESLDEIKTLTEAQRKCVFHDELKYDYSYQSCISGCKLKRIMAACDCIPFYYSVNCVNLSSICDFKDINCIRKYQYGITNLYEKKTLDNGKILEKCNCDNLCNTNIYSMSFEKNHRFDRENPLVKSKSNSSILNVFFQEYGYIEYQVSLFMSWNDLIASLGGHIGLCLGGSFISIMEPVIYFLLTPFRWVHHRKIKRDKEEAKKRANKESKEQFNGCQKNKNNVFTIGDNFAVSEKLRRNYLNSKNKKELIF